MPLAPSKRGAGAGGAAGRGGPGSKGGSLVPARGVLRPVCGQEAWEHHKPGPPNEPGSLAFFQLILGSLHNLHVIQRASRHYTWKARILCVIDGVGHYQKNSREIIFSVVT